MILNELAQWAALIFMAIFLIGLTRQLGRFMVGEREEIANSVGPDVGKRLPPEVLPDAERERFADAIEASPAGWGALLVVDQECIGCAAALEALEHGGAPDEAPIAALSRMSNADHEERLARVSEVVVVDPDRVSRAGFRVTPFVFIVDADLRVAHKALTGDLHEAVRQWRARNGGGPKLRIASQPTAASAAREE